MSICKAFFHIILDFSTKGEYIHSVEQGVSNVKEKIIPYIRSAAVFIGAFGKWVGIAAIVGLIGGLIGSAFHLSVEYATALRIQKPWLLWLLPLAGLFIVWAYKRTGTEGKGTNAVIGSIHFGKDVPILLVPVIFISTVLTHLCGGSAGREGAALQIGGGLGCNIGRLLKLSAKDEPLATICGMSAVFSALFGTPVTATVFALEVSSVGLFHYSGLVPCGTAALVAYGITRLFGIAPAHFAVETIAAEPGMFVRVALLAAVCAFVSVIFCETMHLSERAAEKLAPNAYLRILAGSAIIIALTFAVGSMEYNGAGMDIITRAVEQGQARPFAFLLKILFTAVTLACGFKGGEVVPTFFIGATLGCVVGPLLGLPAGFSAAIGLSAMFCGAVNCPLATVLLSVELFGAAGLTYFAAASFIAYMLSGYSSLYVEQKIMYSKLKAEYINIHAK